MRKDYEYLFVCRCSRQEFYECGCMGRHQCPGASLEKESRIPENAEHTNYKDTLYIESCHL